MSRPTTSICIPTHARNDLLPEAIKSAVAQTQRPDEIVVSDDAGSDEAEAIVTEIARTAPIPVRYVRSPQSGLAANFNHCLLQATTDLVVILHDDDLLLPEAIEKMLRPFAENPEIVAVFGKQLFVNHDGDLIPGESERRNRAYRRTAEHAGVQPQSLLAGIWQQFPNDGFMTKTAAARQVLYRSGYGAAADFDFGVRLAALGKFYYVDEFTCKYRKSHNSILRGTGEKTDDSGYFGMRLLLEQRAEHPELAGEIDGVLRALAPSGIRSACYTGRPGEAVKWYFGPYHRARILTPGGIRRALLIMIAGLEKMNGGRPSG